MMTKKTVCCDTCFSNIARRHSAAAKMWADFVETINQQKQIIYPSDHNSIFYLEKEGYILTHETGSNILIRVYLIRTEVANVACINEDHHDT